MSLENPRRVSFLLFPSLALDPTDHGSIGRLVSSASDPTTLSEVGVTCKHSRRQQCTVASSFWVRWCAGL